MASKRIPDDLAQRYIHVEATLKDLQAERGELKSRLEKLYARGYDSPLLEIVKSERQTIPWRELCEGLVEEYMSVGEARRWRKNLDKKYPPQPIAPTIRAAKEKDGE